VQFSSNGLLRTYGWARFTFLDRPNLSRRQIELYSVNSTKQIK